MPTATKLPLPESLYPPAAHLNVEEKAPAALKVEKLVISKLNSAVVGTRYPEGQGLFIPSIPCHKLLF